MRELKVNIADCSADRLIRAAKKCGFVIGRGKKHYKIETPDGRFVTTVPRHSRLKKELARGIVERLTEFSPRKIIFGDAKRKN
jgi:hypothetical protein